MSECCCFLTLTLYCFFSTSPFFVAKFSSCPVFPCFFVALFSVALFTVGVFTFYLLYVRLLIGSFTVCPLQLLYVFFIFCFNS